MTAARSGQVFDQAIALTALGGDRFEGHTSPACWSVVARPLGVHVAHVMIDAAFVRDNFPQHYSPKNPDGILDPDHIADENRMLHRQPRDACTDELDLRPWIGNF